MTPTTKDWEMFFAEHGDSLLDVRFYENRGTFTVEELFQAIKERLKDEIARDA